MSIVHDVKDHYLYGLGITDLTEFQGIVQTYYGREVAGGQENRAVDGNWSARIKQAISDELFGPRGSRVYNPEAKGLLELYCPEATPGEAEAAFNHMEFICLSIMQPQIAALYEKHPLLRKLQASTLDQPELVDAYLPQLRWDSRERRALRLADNIGADISVRAYIDDEVETVTRNIRDQIRRYVGERKLTERFHKIFDTTGYLLPISQGGEG